jgi:hypothetical protein
MDNNLKQQLNSLKSIKPTDSWVSKTREDLFPKEESIFLNSLQPKFAFGSLAMAGLLFGLIVVGNYGSYPDVEMTQNRVTPRIKEIVQNMKQEEETMFAAQQKIEETQAMVANIDYSKLSEKEQRDLVKEETKRMLAEIADLEERVSRVMGVQKESAE